MKPCCAATCVAIIVCVTVLCSTARVLLGQTPLAPASGPATNPSAELVTLDFPGDGIEIAVLAEIVTRQLHIPILYDEQVRNKKVIIRVPLQVPQSALMGILQSALRLKQLALVDAEQPGWKQIVPATSLAGVATPIAAGGEGPVAQVFLLAHADPARLVELIRAFLSQPGGYIQAQAGQKTLIVSDYPSVLRRVEPLIRRLDADAPAMDVRFVSLKQAESAQVVQSVTQLISNRETFQWGTGAQPGIFLSADERTNQVVVLSPPQRMQEVLDLIASLDKAPALQTKVYRLKAISPERLDRVLKGLLGAAASRSYQAVADADSQSLVVAASPEVLGRIDQLLPELDAALPESQTPIRFYKLRNTKAADVLATISGLLSENSDNPAETGNNVTTPTARTAEGVGTSSASGRTGTENANPIGSSVNRTATQSNLANSSTLAQPANSAMSSTTGGVSVGNTSDSRYISPALPQANGSANSQSPAMTSVHARNATVAADANTNSIVVIAPPQLQQIYGNLIRQLDERRPQVQIECTIVTLDTSDGFTFGVDIGKLGGIDTSKLLTLSSFGISNPDPASGKLAPVNATGGTFALLSPKIADIVLRALATNSRARLVSSPQLLVNDNGKGKLESVAQQPFAVILDASNVQTLTSLGGLAQAGTSITVEPHISEADYLQLTYSIELSNFTGSAQNGLPPPSEKNAVDSSVTIPDGYTIVVGGLTTKNFTSTVNKIPILGDIPILGLLFGARSRNTSDSTLFVFIRPIILRDDKFEDLKYLSGLSLKSADLPGDFPVSKPVAMH